MNMKGYRKYIRNEIYVRSKKKKKMENVWIQKISIPLTEDLFPVWPPTPQNFPFQGASQYSPHLLEFPWFFYLGPPYPLEIPYP